MTMEPNDKNAIMRFLETPGAGIWILAITMALGLISIVIIIGVLIVVPDTWVLRLMAIALNVIAITGVTCITALAILGYRFWYIPPAF
jgi:hypothetical protein